MMLMEHDVVKRAVCGNAEALAFLRAMAEVLHFFDDLSDRDQAITDDAIHAALWRCLVDLPRNAFYAEHFDGLNPIVVNAIVNWRCANRIERAERADGDDLRIAFIVRSSYADLLLMCATIIGGVEWAVAVSVEVKRWVHAEGFVGYLANLAAEKAARERNNHVLR